MHKLWMAPFLAVCIAAMVSGAEAADQGSEIARQGQLRVALVAGNPVLVTKRPDSTLGGVSVELAKYIAGKLGVVFQPVPYPDPAAYAESFGKGEWELAIGPHTPVAEQHSDLSPDFMLVDNIYLAVPGREFADVSQVDRPDVRIAVAKNGAPDQYLTKALKHADLVRLDEATIVEALRTGRADVYGSNAENVDAASKKVPGSKIIPAHFARSIWLWRCRRVGAQQRLAQLVTEAKALGLVKRVLDENRTKGVRVAP
jgi:polar amino acid transport system substrate-binding protein